ncbi:MAG: glycerol-3-phosphate 1-O-acyltransferase PlsY [Thermoanaerobaculia bacterium]
MPPLADIAFPALVVLAYLLGSISFGLLLVRRSRGVDVRTLGSGNPGATNALRAAGPSVAVAVLVLDMAKGLLPVATGRAAGLPERQLAWIAAAAVLGHVFPLWHRFRGGKGVATAAGTLAALAPRPLIASAALFALTVATTRIVSLGSVVAALTVPLWWLAGARLGWWSGPDGMALAGCAAICLLVLWRHRDNLARLLRGEEPKLGSRRRGEAR